MTTTRPFGRRGAPQILPPIRRPIARREEGDNQSLAMERGLLVDWGKYAAALVVVVAAIAAVAAARSAGDVPEGSSAAVAERKAETKCGATLAEFYDLGVGMSYEQARDTIGCDGEIASQVSLGGTNSVMISWQAENTMFGNMNATFQNGVMVSRAQFGLK